MTVRPSELVHNCRPLAHLDLAGGGQVVVEDGFAYVGHMKPPHGTTIIDVRDPRRPRVLAELPLEGDASHTHKVRVAGDLMVTNVEMNNRHARRKAGTDGHYAEGGFKIWDIADRTRPHLLAYVRTHGFGVHRFDLDGRYAYISTEMPGYVGNILVIYDLAEPSRPAEVSRWWLPGQGIGGGEVPTWQGYGHRLHHALRQGSELWAAVWQAGFRVIDIADIARPRTVAGYNYHPWTPEPTHTVLPAAQRLAGRRVAVVIDEEHHHVRGQPHAHLWLFDVTDLSAIRPLSTFHVSEMDSPWSRAGGAFGAHQFQEHIDGTLVFATWFAGGLRIVDIADPMAPAEVGWFIPEPVAGNRSPQSNDVDADERGLIYLIDRNCGFDIIELTG